ncbi:MAG: tetratricopeptide repeat protein [Candidatus Entotheonellia bacterium]
MPRHGHALRDTLQQLPGRHLSRGGHELAPLRTRPSTPTIGWVLVGVGGLTLILLTPFVRSRREAFWLYHHDVGTRAYERGNYDKAERHYLSALKYAEGFESENNRLAQALNNLAAVYQSQKRYDEAEPLYERALGIYERAVGPGPNRAAETRRNLEGLRSERSRYAGLHHRKVRGMEDTT